MYIFNLIESPSTINEPPPTAKERELHPGPRRARDASSVPANSSNGSSGSGGGGGGGGDVGVYVPTTRGYGSPKLNSYGDPV